MRENRQTDVSQQAVELREHGMRSELTWFQINHIILNMNSQCM